MDYLINGSIKEAFEKEEIIDIDCYFAEEICSHFKIVDGEQFLFLARLMASSRLGHLCLNRTDYPVPNLAPDLFSHLLVKDQGRYYLQRNWLLESSFLNHLQRISIKKESEKEIGDSKSTIYNSEQICAIKNALQNPLSIVTGGPGTGKSFTAEGIVEHFTRQSAISPLIYIAAPTGRAAAKLAAAIKRKDSIAIHSSTLHSLLKVRSSKDFGTLPEPIDADLLIVDEASMIDASLFTRLFAAITSKTHLVLLGDPYQLPAVESGSLFSDLIEVIDDGALFVPKVHLEKCMRTDRLELLEFASAVKSGNGEPLKKKVLSLDRREIELKGFWKLAEEKRFPPFHTSLDEEKLIDLEGRFRTLSALRKGEWGSDSMNQYFYERDREKLPESGLWAIPILITKSDRALGVASGDSGLLIRNVSAARAGKEYAPSDFALFPIKDSAGNYLRIPIMLLPRYELAYVISIHKSQGSEYNEVAIILPPGCERFGREILYTAVTRAKEDFYLYCDQERFKELLTPTSRKISGIRERIKIIKKSLEPSNL